MNPLCIRELAEIAGGSLQFGCLPPLGGEHEPLGRVTTQSDRVQPGDVFWSVERASENSSWRAEEAFANGALGAVVSGRRLEPWAGKFSLQVDNAQAALWRLAQAMRRRFSGTLVAVAGGGLERIACKTIQSVLRCKPEDFATDELHEEAGVALRLVGLGERESFGVIELKAGECGELERLANRCCPHVGVLMGGANGFDTPANVAATQVELLSTLPKDGCAIVNGDDVALRHAVGRAAAQVVWFGSGPHCDVYASDIEWCADGLSLVIDGQPLRMPACGSGQVSAALAAYAVGRVLEISPRRIAAALGRYRPAVTTNHATSEEYALTT